MYLTVPGTDQAGTGSQVWSCYACYRLLLMERPSNLVQLSSAMGQTPKLALLHAVGEDRNHDLFAQLRRWRLIEVFRPDHNQLSFIEAW